MGESFNYLCLMYKCMVFLCIQYHQPQQTVARLLPENVQGKFLIY